MRRLVSMAASLLGLLALGALVVILALTFGGLPREAKPASQAFQSPIETPTPPPYPPPATPTASQPETPRATRTPAPTGTPVPPEIATVIAKATKTAYEALTPHPPLPTPLPFNPCTGFWQPFWYRVTKSEEAIFVVEQELPRMLIDPHEAPFVEGEITLGTPVPVDLIDAKLVDKTNNVWPDAIYYDVPIFRQGKIASVARIFVPYPEEQIGRFSVLQKVPDLLIRWPPISAGQAIALVEQEHGRVIGQPVLATGDIRPLHPREVGPIAAFWQLQTDDGKVWFVTPDRTWQKAILLDAEETVATLFGYDLRFPTPTPLGMAEPMVTPYPIRTPEDALSAVQGELSWLRSTLTTMIDKSHGKISDFTCALQILDKETSFGTPVAVRPLYTSHDPLHSDLFYDVPVLKGDRLLLFRVFVNTQRREGFVGSWTIFPANHSSQWPPISREQAVALLESERHETVVGEPKLVSARLRQGDGFCMWQLHTADGKRWLVTFDNGGTILNADATDLATLAPKPGQ